MSMFSGPSLRLDDSKLDYMLNSTTGDVGRHMRWIGLQILAGARRLVGVDTGRLKRSLYMKHERTLRGQYVQVGSPLSYARDHHEGTRPHVIEPGRGRVLQFNVRGRRVYAQRVMHPGTRGRKYLTIPLRQAVR